jgi:hypothetical protein
VTDLGPAANAAADRRACRRARTGDAKQGSLGILGCPAAGDREEQAGGGGARGLPRHWWDARPCRRRQAAGLPARIYRALADRSHRRLHRIAAICKPMGRRTARRPHQEAARHCHRDREAQPRPGLMHPRSAPYYTLALRVRPAWCDVHDSRVRSLATDEDVANIPFNPYDPLGTIRLRARLQNQIDRMIWRRCPSRRVRTDLCRGRHASLSPVLGLIFIGRD